METVCKTIFVNFNKSQYFTISTYKMMYMIQWKHSCHSQRHIHGPYNTILCKNARFCESDRRKFYWQSAPHKAGENMYRRWNCKGARSQKQCEERQEAICRSKWELENKPNRNGGWKYNKTIYDNVIITICQKYMLSYF